MRTFPELGVPRDLDDDLAMRGLTRPFPVQAAAIPPAMAGRDLCGRAPTGSGKTLAFALPLAARVGAAASRRPRALVLAPTRELAKQITETMRPLLAVRGRSVFAFYGGTSVSADEKRLKAGVDVAVACPGRLADLLERRAVDLRDVELVVVDEADRMADMGFLPEVRRLLDRTPATRQTLLFSATLDGDVAVLTRNYQRDPVRVEVDQPEEQRGDVRHVFWGAEPSERARITGDLVRATTPAIVFTRTKHGADRVAKQLSRGGAAAVAIHGDRSQRQRERALADFTAGKATTLVATDVAARGIHVDGIALVVHFDPPATDKDYVHRSGRTGRAGATGLVVTLVPPDKRKDVTTLQRTLGLPTQVGHPTRTLDDLPAATEQPRITAHAEPDHAAPRPATRTAERAAPGRGAARRDGGRDAERAEARRSAGRGHAHAENGRTPATRSGGGRRDGQAEPGRARTGGGRGNGRGQSNGRRRAA